MKGLKLEALTQIIFPQMQPDLPSVSCVFCCYFRTAQASFMEQERVSTPLKCAWFQPIGENKLDICEDFAGKSGDGLERKKICFP